LDVLGPGTHTLSTKNLPILSKLVGLVYGGNSPFASEVYFVNKAGFCRIKLKPHDFCHF